MEKQRSHQDTTTTQLIEHDFNPGSIYVSQLVAVDVEQVCCASANMADGMCLPKRKITSIKRNIMKSKEDFLFQIKGKILNV